MSDAKWDDLFQGWDDGFWEGKREQEKSFTQAGKGEAVFDACEALKGSEKAIMVKTPIGTRWAPISCILHASEVKAVGDKGKLVVTSWLAKKWDGEGGDALIKAMKELPHEIENVVCLQESAKAILVQIGEEEMWLPKSQIDESSEVTGDGDSGALRISKWIARTKGFIK